MFKKIAVLGIILLGIIGFVFRHEIKDLLTGSKRSINTVEVKLLLEDDYSIDSLASILVEKNVISTKEVFIEEAKKQSLSDTSFDAGKYIILSGTKIPELVVGFSKDENGNGRNELKVNVVFNRCKTIEDIGKNISKCIQADSASLVDYILNPNTLKKYGFTLEQVPALFIPGDYQMYYDSDAADFVFEMAEKFKEFWNTERMSKLQKIGLRTPSQLTTLASIVYSEQSRVPAEWPVIAKLYLNRISIGMKLQSDPTFKYCWGTALDNVTRLRAKHRSVDCPYNTYLYEGLPPGPICIVPAKVLDSVLEPANVDYLFMCAKMDYSGEHNFTNSGGVHMKNARDYQNWLSKEQAN